VKPVPRLHVVTTRGLLEREDFLEFAAGLLRVEGLALHLRAHGENGRLLLARARELKVSAPHAALIVNDRIDVAAIAGTGAHLPELGLTVAQARPILGQEPHLGRSIHAPPSPAWPAAERPDYLFFGHVFETPSKSGLRPGGLEGLRKTALAAAASGGIPVIAIGGVTPERAAAVVATGAYGVAVISGVWDAPEPAQAAARYLDALGGR
jgi:thiazole tautomerase (transcriptional regulator TenI)